MISPEKGGDSLAFVKADLQQGAQVPLADQRYGNHTRQDAGGKPQAFNLQQQPGEREHAGRQQS